MSNRVDSMLRLGIPCYFCNRFLEEKYLLDHVKQCEAVLEECPHRCGVYVPRKNMESHRKTCDRDAVERNSRVTEAQDFLWKSKVHSALTLLRSIIKKEESERMSLQADMSRCLSMLQSQQESVETLQVQLVKMTKEYQRSGTTLGQRLNDLEVTCDSMEQRTAASFQRISEQLSLLHAELVSNQNKHDGLLDNWYLEVKDVKAFLSRESSRVTKMWQEQQQSIRDLKSEMEMRCEDARELMERQQHIMERITGLTEEVQGQAAAVDAQESSMKGLKLRMKENLTHVERLIRENLKLGASRLVECNCRQEGVEPTVYPSNGRLLWRIGDYEEKMAAAKESDSAIYSGKFSNKEYGYTLRMELFLNGIGQWKGRHVIGRLRVEAGDWDPLLEWPCVLRATVTLRNQEDASGDVKKVVKAVGLDKSNPNPKDVNKESGTYMFIPHTTINRNSGYIKDDVLFLDVQVIDISTTASTPSLSS